MLKRIKYALLRWLLDDICLKSECDKCLLEYDTELMDSVTHGCLENDVFVQARKVWDLDVKLLRRM